ncbi:two-component system, cell cycle response regulator [Gammaproteobacteria bacterium]
MTINHQQLAAAGDILVVDDSPENLKLMLDVLATVGYRVRAAINGELALRSVQVKAPVLILLDIGMPGLDGFEVCQRLKANKVTQEIPIIFITALTDMSDKIKGFELGAVDYINKPLNAQEVLMRVATHLQLFVTQQQLQVQNIQLREVVAQLECANHALIVAQQQLANYSNDLEQQVAERTQALLEANQKLQKLTEYDYLTGIANRRKFDSFWKDECNRALRQGASLAVILIDIDHFKDYNDYYGHQAGDICLQRVAQAMMTTVQRRGDLLARYGGEEFIVILPDISATDARQVAESMRAAVQALNIPHAKNKIASVVTISLGVAYMTTDAAHNFPDLIGEADANLYQAKRQGRNRVVY